MKEKEEHIENIVNTNNEIIHKKEENIENIKKQFSNERKKLYAENKAKERILEKGY